MKILVASKNPVKISAVEEAFSKYFSDFKVIGHSVASGVSHTPIGDEIYQGAETRAKALMNLNIEQKIGAHYFVGIEGGFIEDNSKWFLSNRACIMGVDGKISYGTSLQYEVPGYIAKQVLSGVELGTVMDEIKGDTNTKQKGGAVEFLSKGAADRKELTTQAVLAALFPHVNQEIYSKKPKTN